MNPRENLGWHDALPTVQAIRTDWGLIYGAPHTLSALHDRATGSGEEQGRDEEMDTGIPANDDSSEEDIGDCFLGEESKKRELESWRKMDPCGTIGRVGVDRDGNVYEDGGTETAWCQSVKGHRGAHDDGYRTWVRTEKPGIGFRRW